MAKKPSPSAPSESPEQPESPETAPAVAVEEVGVHPGDPVSTDEDPVDDSAGVLTPEQAKQGVLDMLDDSIGELWKANGELTAQVKQLQETVNRLNIVVTGMVNMPEHSSLSRPFAERCSGVLRGSVEVPQVR